MTTPEAPDTPVAPAPRRRSHVWGAVILGIAMLAILMPGNSMIGITYDEPIYQSKSVQALDWLGLFVTSPSLAVTPDAIDHFWLAKDQHPGFFKLLTAVCGATLGRLLPYNATWRAGTNLLCAVCFAALYLFVLPVWGRAVAVYAACALLLMPRVFAHCHLAALDAPIMSLTFLTLVAVWHVCLFRGGQTPAEKRSAWVWAAIAGVLWGLGLGTKLNAFFVPFIVFPWVLLFARGQFWRLAVGFAVCGPLAFLITWPWLWHETLPRFAEYFQFHFQHYPVSVMYFGEFCVRAPWHYPLVMGAITLPPATLALALLGLGRSGILRASDTGDDAVKLRKATLALVLWALFVYLVPMCLPNTPKYGGVRLFLPVFPLVAVLAAVGLRGVLDWLIRRIPNAGADVELRRKLTVLVLFLALLGPLMAVAKFTPYHLSYYNGLIGGLPGATRAGMEPIYWGDTYRSAALWLAEHAPQGATVWVDPVGFESTVRLFELGPMRPDLGFAAGPEGFNGADYAVTQNKPIEFSEISRKLVAEERPVYTDGIDGVPLIYVFKLR